MGLAGISQSQYVTLQWISCAIGMIFLIFILIHHYGILKSSKKLKFYSTPLFSLLMIISGMTFCGIEIIEILISDITNTTTKCYIFLSFELISYSLFKLFLYFALCARLTESYSNAQIYSTKFLICWQVYIVIITIINDIIALTFIELDLTVSPCRGINIPWTLGIFVTNDFILCAVNVLLFTIPLCNATKLLSKGEYEQNIEMKTRFQYLLRKSCILACLSVISSLVLVGMIAVVECAALWLTLDIIITTLCIVLLFKQYDHTFDCCCGCLMGKFRKTYKDSVGKSRFRMGLESLILLSSSGKRHSNSVRPIVRNNKSETESDKKYNVVEVAEGVKEDESTEIQK